MSLHCPPPLPAQLQKLQRQQLHQLRQRQLLQQQQQLHQIQQLTQQQQQCGHVDNTSSMAYQPAPAPVLLQRAPPHALARLPSDSDSFDTAFNPCQLGCDEEGFMRDSNEYQGSDDLPEVGPGSGFRGSPDTVAGRRR